jgi:hypothetical protein
MNMQILNVIVVSVVTVITIFVIGYVGFAIYLLHLENLEKRKKKADENFINMIAPTTPLFYYNDFHAVTALCLAKDFDGAVKKFKADVKNGQKKAWEKKWILVPNTFTFSSNFERQNVSQIGDINDFYKLKNKITENFIEGLEDNQLLSIFCIKGVLFKLNRQLFVPYIDQKSVPFKLQEKVYGNKVGNLQEVIKLFMNQVEAAKPKLQTFSN